MDERISSLRDGGEAQSKQPRSHNYKHQLQTLFVNEKSDIYRSILGPTTDETILAGLQTVMDMLACHSQYTPQNKDGEFGKILEEFSIGSLPTSDEGPTVSDPLDQLFPKKDEPLADSGTEEPQSAATTISVGMIPETICYCVINKCIIAW